jgi:hypothetical protein
LTTRFMAFSKGVRTWLMTGIFDDGSAFVKSEAPCLERMPLKQV